ncbi:hypothetical protein [Sphingomonas sp.]|uniref:type II toxin-antitoxin system antitoxin SocA domain-containing protein n=1 Tax=Sphingomonas sp. TaxID=28214 RepID=UPI00180CF5E6|nr:hypothetical protein [Sphingomonas sp.]MBA4760287.1 hypothetical protein [Sphingomonas sp.]
MDVEQAKPLITLTERDGDKPSRIVVTFPTPRNKAGAWRRFIQRGVAFTRKIRNAISMILAAEPGDLLSYEPKRDKIVEGVLLLVERARDGGFTPTTHLVTAAMFLADKGHLDAYGRPVFFDNYAATAAGPVGLAAEEMLRPSFDWSSVGMDAAPWTTESAGDGHRLLATRAPNLRRLSQSDLELLTSALSMVTALDAEQLRHFTCRQTAYAAAWRNGEGSRLDPRLIPEERDDSLIDDLLYASRHAFDAPHRS